jgi:hypothetical protein
VIRERIYSLYVNVRIIQDGRRKIETIRRHGMEEEKRKSIFFSCYIVTSPPTQFSVG